MYVAIYNRVFEVSHVEVFKNLFRIFESHNIVPIVYAPLAEALVLHGVLKNTPELFSDLEPLNSRVKYLFSLGGDGTLLDTVKYVGGKNVSVLGINLGRLGFLASTGADEIEFAVQALTKGSYVLDPRSMIHLDATCPVFADAPFALNEFSIHRKDSSSLIKIHTFLNGQFLCTYWADGIIVSTPTGSTGYSLSCGGPIIFPQANSFVITPVAPHNLNVRPIVVADTSIVSFEIEGRAEQFLCTLDARSQAIDSGVSLAVRKEDFNLNLIRLEGQNFLHTLQTKLYWGADRRN